LNEVGFYPLLFLKGFEREGEEEEIGLEARKINIKFLKELKLLTLNQMSFYVLFDCRFLIPNKPFPVFINGFFAESFNPRYNFFVKTRWFYT